MKKLAIEWKLRDIMAQRGMYHTSDLQPGLAERGIQLSTEQIWRLVTQTPLRIQLDTLAALCDLLECDLASLIHISELKQQVPKRRVAAGDSMALPATVKPIPAAIKKPSSRNKT
jgi:DNA-binding Xre family transcriptional regulator